MAWYSSVILSKGEPIQGGTDCLERLTEPCKESSHQRRRRATVFLTTSPTRLRRFRLVTGAFQPGRVGLQPANMSLNNLGQPTHTPARQRTTGVALLPEH